MKRIIIGIIILFAMITTVGAYTLKDGKILLDNSDTAIIVNQYDGSTQNYLAHITTVESLVPKTGLLRLTSPTGCTNCTCTATNPSEDISVKGTLIATYSYKGLNVSVNFADVCKKDLGFTDATGVLKVNCDNNVFCNFPKWTLYDCPNKDCKDGTCTKLQIPEFTIAGLLIAIIAGITLIIYKKR